MKIFIAYKYTGEEISKLKEFMKKICFSLEEAGHTHYCTLWENESKFNNKSKMQIMQHAFEKIDESDLVLVLLKTQEKSEGMLIEVGYCLSKNKKIVLAVKKEITNTYLRDLANKIIEFNNIEDLTDKLKKINI